MSATEPADLALDPALLMGSLDAGDAEERVVAVMGAQRDEPRVLQPLAAQRDPDHRRGQVVVADHPDRDPAERLERADVAVEERLLGLVGIGDVDGLARVRQTQAEHEQLHHHPGDHRLELTEVDLGLLSRRVGLGDHHLRSGALDLDPQLGHQLPDAGLRHHRTLLIEQPLPDPARGVALLAWRGQIGDQPPPDRGLIRPEHRRGPHRRLPHRRHRIGQRRPNRAAMHPVPISERPDRHLFVAGITSDTFELLHSRSHSHPYAS